MSGSSEATKMQLINATIRLVAAHGVKGVSLRTLTAEAGCRNLTAVHYHFGGKQQLLDAALLWFSERMVAVGEPGFAEIERRMDAGAPVSPGDVTRAWILPAATSLAAPGNGPLGMRFFARILTDAAGDASVTVVTTMMPYLMRVLNMFQYSVPDVPPEVLAPRIVILFNSLAYALSDVPGINSARESLGLDIEPVQALHYFIEYHAAGISAPMNAVPPELREAAEESVNAWRQILDT